MPVHESELNVRLAVILSESFGLDCRAERTRRRVRPDIKCFYNGLRIVIEASFSAGDAERDARRRIEEGLADIALALHYKQSYPDIPERELKNMLKGSVFDVLVIAPRELKGLEKFLLGKMRVAELKSGWFTDVKLETVADFIKHSTAYMIEESEIKQEVEKIKQAIGDFIKVAGGIPSSGRLRESVANALYRLYGFSVAESKDAEIIFGQSALAILLSAVFYERLRHAYGLRSLGERVSSEGPIKGLRLALEELLKIDYEPALKLAVEILGEIPPVLSSAVSSLVEHALRISQMNHLLARDFAGRIYHEVTGNIAVRKGFATFYTEVPAAYMLANLALRAALGIRKLEDISREESVKVLEAVFNLKIADFACGSGTLLTASLYNASRIARALCFLHDLECPDIEKKLVEEGIYGLDALRYATQISAINLALMSPATISRENVNAVYLGYIPGKGAWLGSLELLDNEGKVGGILRWIEGGLKEAVESVSVTSAEGGKIRLLNSYDVVIMNPPFTRATGRVSEEFEETKKGLFGFIADESARKVVKRKYDEVRDRIREELTGILSHLVKTEQTLRELWRLALQQRGREREDEERTRSIDDLKQFLNIGQAGEGLLFLHLAYKYVKPGGVIAFVLPRNLLSGVSWFLARALLASKFHVKYIVVSSDSENGYNFSENTSLSECLIVAKRIDKHDPNEETTFINLLKKPKSALEAIVLSDRIVEGAKDFAELPGGGKCLVSRFKRSELLKNLDNWNRLIFVPEPKLVELSLGIVENGDLGILGVRVPIVRLAELVETIGVDAHQFHDHFSRVNTVTPYPVVYGGKEDVRLRIIVRPNAYASEKTNKAAEIYRRFSGRLLVPDRIWLDTTHVIALFSEVPVLSNIFYAVRLKNADVCAEKALAYWLNTTWGVLSVLASREETRGRWMRLKMMQWKLLPVLDVSRLGGDTLRRISSELDELSKASPRRIIEQYSENPSDVDPVRLKIDLGFLRALNPSINEDEAKEKLIEIYRRMAIGLKRWAG